MSFIFYVSTLWGNKAGEGRETLEGHCGTLSTATFWGVATLSKTQLKETHSSTKGETDFHLKTIKSVQDEETTKW